MTNADFKEIKAILHSLAVSNGESNNSKMHINSAGLRDLEIKLRRMRNELFPVGYFSDAAWDILLALDKAAREGRRYVVSDTGAEMGIPPTTILRYIAKMERDGYIQRESDPNDRRRTFVSLTSQGAHALDSTFDRTTIDQSSVQ